MLENKLVQVAYIQTCDLPQEWSDENISKHFKELRLSINCGDIAWCHINERLFEDSYICKNYTDTPVKKGCKRVKYAYRSFATLPFKYTKQEGDLIFARTAERFNYLGFIWCEEDETLFNSANSKCMHNIRDKDVYIKTTPLSLYKKTDEEELKKSYIYSDHPSTMENSTATILYILVMIVGAIFKDRLLIWVAASVIYFSFINRYKIREKKWNKMQEEKKKNKK